MKLQRPLLKQKRQGHATKYLTYNCWTRTVVQCPSTQGENYQVFLSPQHQSGFFPPNKDLSPQSKPCSSTSESLYLSRNNDLKWEKKFIRKMNSHWVLQCVPAPLSNFTVRIPSESICRNTEHCVLMLVDFKVSLKCIYMCMSFKNENFWYIQVLHWTYFIK